MHPASVQWNVDFSQLQIEWFNQKWAIQLQENKLLGSKNKTHPHIPILFRGVVNNNTHSWSRFALLPDKTNSKENKLNLSGYIYHERALYELHYAELTNSYNISPVTHNALRLNRPKSTTSDSFTNPVTGTGSAGKDSTGDSAKPRKAIKIGIAIDSQYNRHYNNRGLAQALSIINGVDGIFQQHLGLAIIVDDYIVYENEQSDPLAQFNGSAESVLDTFRAARLRDNLFSSELALVHLFTGSKNSDRKIGLSWLDTLCDANAYNSSLSTPFSFSILLAAHEIAHNLGATHDTDHACINDSLPESTDLMWPEISGNTKANFSACSQRQILSALNASCVIDDIDVSISLASDSPTRNGHHTLQVSIGNLDKFRSVSDITSRIVYPTQVHILQIPDECTLSNSTVECQHVNINPESKHRFDVTADLLSLEEVIISAEVLVDTLDTLLFNNTQTTVLKKSEAYRIQPVDPLPPQTVQLTFDASSSGDSSTTGIGLWDYIPMSTLVLLAISRLVFLVGSFYRVVRDPL